MEASAFFSSLAPENKSKVVETQKILTEQKVRRFTSHRTALSFTFMRVLLKSKLIHSQK